jgi:multidrug efflux pump subunit AcrA (membrane-fusion protein)
MVAVLVLGALLIVPRLLPAASADGDLPPGERYRVELGSVTRAVHAVGTLAPARRANLSPRVEGRVAEVLVAPGDEVRAGQPVLTLDTVPLDLAVAWAEADLQAAEARQIEGQAGASRPAVEAAEREREAKLAALDAARSRLQSLLDGPSPSSVVELERAVARAEAELQARRQPYTPEELEARRESVAEAEALLRLQLQPAALADVEQQRERVS